MKWHDVSNLLQNNPGVSGRGQAGDADETGVVTGG